MLVVFGLSLTSFLLFEIQYLPSNFHSLCHVTRRSPLRGEIGVVPSKSSHRVTTMPEIAEVERARTILDQILVGQTIIDVEAVPLPPHNSLLIQV